MRRILSALLPFGMAGAIALGVTGNAFAADRVDNAVTQAAVQDQGDGGFYAESVGDHEIKVTLSGASFREIDGGVQVVNDDGVVVDGLGSKLQSETGQKVDAEYVIVAPNEVVIRYSDAKRYLPGVLDYAKCVGKGAVGGAAGGCVVGAVLGAGGGCVPGAAAGGLGGGVGSLITCA